MIQIKEKTKDSYQWRAVLMALFVDILVLYIHLVNDEVPISFSYKLLVLSLLFFLIILLYYIFPVLTRNVIIVAVAFSCIYNIYLGLSQLFGFRFSNNCLYAVTGSFGNPGPFGGYLAVCISLLAAFYLNKTDYGKHIQFYKILYSFISIIIIISILVLPSTQSRSAVLSLGVSAFFLILGNERIKSQMKQIVSKYGLLLFALFIALGIGAYLFKKPSADGRFFIQKISIKAMIENGTKGAGIGRFGGEYGKTQAKYFQSQIENKGKGDIDWNSIDTHERQMAGCPEYAFNEYMFIGVEYGPVVLFIFLCFTVILITISFKRHTIWCYGLISLSVFAFFSYPLHTAQFHIIYILLYALCLIDREPCEPIYKKNTKSFSLLVISVLALSIIIMVKKPSYYKQKRAEIAWNKTEQLYKSKCYEYVVENCDTLFPYMKYDPNFLLVYGQSLNKEGDYVKSNTILTMGTEYSCDLSFWYTMGDNSLALGHYREAEEYYKHAFYMVPNRLYPLYYLAKLYNAEGDTIKFLEMAEMVETFVPKIESSITESLREEVLEMRNHYK